MNTFQEHFREELDDLKASISELNKNREENLQINVARHANQELAVRIRCHFYQLVLGTGYVDKESLRKDLIKHLMRPIKKVGVYSTEDIIYDVCFHNAAREMLDKLDQYPWGVK